MSIPTGRDTRPTGVGICGSEVRVPSAVSSESNGTIWRYRWNGTDLVTVQLGLNFQFKRNDDVFTSHNVSALVDHFERMMRDERERNIRGSHIIAWFASIWSGHPPDRSHDFRAMDRAVFQAQSAAAARDLTGVIHAIEHGIRHLNYARRHFQRYMNEHIAGAEANESILRVTRDVSLTVSTTVLTGGASLGTNIAVAVGTTALTTGAEEILVSDFGRSAVIDWRRIGQEAMMAVFAELMGPLVDKFGKAIADAFGTLANKLGMTDLLTDAVKRKFPTIDPDTFKRMVESMGSQMRRGEAGTFRFSDLGRDGAALRRIVASAAVDTFRRLPRNAVSSLMRTLAEDLNAAMSGSEPLTPEQFIDKVVDRIVESSHSYSRLFMVALVASLED